MTLRVSIKLPIPPGSTAYATNPYDTYHALDDGVTVGPGGELKLVSSREKPICGGHDSEYHIYAAGAWLEASVTPAEE